MEKETEKKTEAEHSRKSRKGDNTMPEDLISRIQQYEIRVRDAYERQRDTIFGYDDDEDRDEEEPEEAETDSEEKSGFSDFIPFVFPFDYEPETETVEYGRDQEIIRGHISGPKQPCTSKARSYTVSPDNPWYFDIDGVVFSKETGLLVSFPPERGEEYTVPDDDRITGIGDCAFAGNSRLKRVVFNSRILYIGKYAFAGCGAMTECTVPACVRFLQDGAFSMCGSLKTAVLNCRLKGIPYRLFIKDTALETVRFPAETECIYRGAFSGCTSLVDVKAHEEENSGFDVILPPSLHTVHGEAFLGCTSVRSIQMTGVRLIEDKAFTGCAALKTVSAENAEVYRAYCFMDCTSLEEFTFGTKTLKLGRDLFWGADNLKTIRLFCAPGFSCAADALPENITYEMDAAAWLGNGNMYRNVALFKACVRNIADGETVPENLYREMLRTLKRNRKKLYEWFLSEPAVLRMIIREDIPDCTDCLVMSELAKEMGIPDFEVEKSIQNYSPKQIDKARQKLTEAECVKQEKERKASRLQAEAVRQKAARKQHVSFFELTKIRLEELNLPEHTCNCLLNQGICNLRELAVMSADDLKRIPGLEQSSITEIREKLEAMTGIRIPETREKEPENREPESFAFTLDDLAGLEDF